MSIGTPTGYSGSPGRYERDADLVSKGFAPHVATASRRLDDQQFAAPEPVTVFKRDAAGVLADVLRCLDDVDAPSRRKVLAAALAFTEAA